MPPMFGESFETSLFSGLPELLGSGFDSDGEGSGLSSNLVIVQGCIVWESRYDLTEVQHSPLMLENGL